MAQIYLSLGSNVDREASIQGAIDRLTERFGPLQVSPTYEATAVGFDGDAFHNLVVGATSDLQPGEIDRQLKAIEAELGRRRDGPKFGDRTIDIDLLLYDDRAGVVDGIELPRDEIHRYPFVLKPLADLIPEVVCPGTDQTMAQLWQAMRADADGQLRQLDRAQSLPPQELKVPARDGFELAASWFPADGDDALIISSATAVPRRLYQRFASHAQSRGLSVLTYDYRGIGGSRPASLRGFDARMRDWCFLDMTGAVDWVIGRAQPRRLFKLGHSVGGQVTGMLDNAAHIDKMVTIVAQSGYWGVQSPAQRLPVWLYVAVMMPLLSRLAGYWPWSKLGASEDLPKGVALEWARWGRSPGYLLDDTSLPLDRYADFAAPVLAYSIEDDGWGSAAAVDAMMKAYPSVERRHLVPAELGLTKLGHMGYFRQAARKLWDEPLDWLLAD